MTRLVACWVQLLARRPSHWMKPKRASGAKARSFAAGAIVGARDTAKSATDTAM